MLYLIVLALIILYYDGKEHFRCTGYENFRSYSDIQDTRSLCDVYIDTFFNSHINAKEEVKSPFLDWCNDFKKKQRYYPEHRAAERVFLKFDRIYGRHYV